MNQLLKFFISYIVSTIVLYIFAMVITSVGELAWLPFWDISKWDADCRYIGISLVIIVGSLLGVCDYSDGEV